MRALVLFASLLLAVPAWADVVHLNNGRSIRGEIISSDTKQVVVRTPEGKLTLPRSLIKRVERENPKRTQEELAKERRRWETPPQKRGVPRRPPKVAGPRAVKKRPGKRTALEAAALALRSGDGKRALGLLEPLARGRKSDRLFQYLYGRANELAGSQRKAYGAFKRALELAKLERLPIDANDIGRVGELARRSFVERLGPGSHGVDTAWRRVSVGQRFAVYHRLKEHGGDTAKRATLRQFTGQLEASLQAVRRTYGIAAEALAGRPRVLVFLFNDRDEHGAARGSHHARHVAAPDGWLHVIESYALRQPFPVPPSRRRRHRVVLDAVAHKVAHVVLREAFRLPAWTEEAAAVWLSKPNQRDRFRLVRLASKATFPPAIEFLANKVKPQGDAREYDAQGFLIFRALVELRGSPRKALALCVRMRELGAREALAAAKLPIKRLQRTCERLAGRRP